MSENRVRTIKLRCPSAAKTASFAAQEEQKLDLGSIARAFGVDPQTLKLNGHFIGRGSDLIASSVTWKSLLSFFFTKRLPTGEDDANPIVVDGKLCRAGTKRVGCDVVDDSRGREAELEDGEFLGMKSKKMRTTSNVGICSKRKQLLEDVKLLKKLKISETNPDIQGSSNGLCKSIASNHFSCSYMSGSMKRMTEDEAGLPHLLRGFTVSAAVV
ncbi:hypothetical protein ACFX13_036254 [Malus domestica]|uniref:uncharacterized protein n=1 Tax=Malus domestica TaxID=3750 RepID=UPI000498FA04|nr:uncharacterized protein LOC103435844 isoform X1 [Malus domestica]XP_050145237.1 uncharacterized protein LOC126620947 [Malus sylvestris]